MDVLVTVGRNTDLDDVSDAGEVHTASGNIGGDHNGGLSTTEAIRDASTLLLSKLAVHRRNLSWVKRVSAVKSVFGLAERLEDAGVKRDVRGGWQVDNCLEWRLGWVLCDLCDLLCADLNEGRCNVFKALARHNVLRNPFVGWRLIALDCLHELEVGLQCAPHKAHHLTRYGGGEEKSLTVRDISVWKKVENGLDILGETLIQQAISLIKDDGLEIGRRNPAVWISQEIVETSWSGHEQMASLTLHLVQHRLLVASANCDLNLDVGASAELLGLDGELLSKLTGRRHDNCTDIRSCGSGAAAHPLTLTLTRKFRAGLQDVL